MSAAASSNWRSAGAGPGPSSKPSSSPSSPSTSQPYTKYNDWVLKLTMGQRYQLLRDTQKVDVYTRLTLGHTYEVTTTSVDRQLLVTFSGDASRTVHARSPMDPQSRPSASVAAIMPPGDDRRDDAPLVWTITGTRKAAVERLIRWMINSCNPQYQNLVVGVTANIPMGMLNSRDRMLVYQAAYMLDMYTAVGKLNRQLDDDLGGAMPFGEILRCWHEADVMSFNAHITTRFRNGVQNHINARRAISMDDLHLFWSDARFAQLPQGAKGAAARLVAEQTITRWNSATDDWTLNKLNPQCYNIIRGVWHHHLQQHGAYHFAPGAQNAPGGGSGA